MIVDHNQPQAYRPVTEVSAQGDWWHPVTPMNTQAWNWSKECAFSSDMTEGHALIAEVMAKLDGTSWGTKDLFAVNLALEEALVNAVNHGNHADPAKKVTFACRLDDNRLYFRIEDEGDGFNPDALPDPTDPENIMVVSGRGVFLIRNFASRVWWNDKGNVLEFEKDRVG